MQTFIDRLVNVWGCFSKNRYKKSLLKQEVKKIEVEDKKTGWKTDYYQLPPGATELQDLIEHKNMNFAVANIFKACYRLGQKTGTSRVYDINKILWFAQREKERVSNDT